MAPDPSRDLGKTGDHLLAGYRARDICVPGDTHYHPGSADYASPFCEKARRCLPTPFHRIPARFGATILLVLTRPLSFLLPCTPPQRPRTRSSRGAPLPLSSKEHLVGHLPRAIRIIVAWPPARHQSYNFCGRSP